MKLIFGVITAFLFSVALLLLIPSLQPSHERKSAIVITIKNDTKHEVELITLTSNKQQTFSCTLLFNICTLGIINSGDADFVVLATLVSGKQLRGGIGYAETGSDHTLLISEFTEEATYSINKRFN